MEAKRNMKGGAYTLPGIGGGRARATLVLGGDFCPVGRYGQAVLAGERVFDEALSVAFRDADLSMVNLEAPLCPAGLPCAHPGETGLRADPAVAAFLARSGIGAAGLANNHIRDFGYKGVLSTIRCLERAGVRHTGAGRNLTEAQEPLAVTLNGLRVGVWALAEKELNVASDTAAGSAWFRPEADAFRIRDLRKAFDFLLVYVHAGHEFMSVPSPRIRAAYRALIDAGADAVVGHHPHVVQGVEAYKRGLIVYSLGNLAFDSAYVSRHPGTDTGCLLRLGLVRRGVAHAAVIPFRMRHPARVTVLDPAERADWVRQFRKLSRLVAAGRPFERAWEEQVRARWEGEFRQVVLGFSDAVRSAGHGKGLARARNLIECPTHVELLGTAFRMMDEGRLPRG